MPTIRKYHGNGTVTNEEVTRGQREAMEERYSTLQKKISTGTATHEEAAEALNLAYNLERDGDLERLRAEVQLARQRDVRVALEAKRRDGSAARAIEGMLSAAAKVGEALDEIDLAIDRGRDLPDHALPDPLDPAELAGANLDMLAARAAGFVSICDADLERYLAAVASMERAASDSRIEAVRQMCAALAKRREADKAAHLANLEAIEEERERRRIEEERAKLAQASPAITEILARLEALERATS